jgi:predicted nucleic acid-binding protein
VDSYPPYIQKARSAGSVLASTTLIFAEVASLAERVAHEAYERTHHGVSKKAFRHLTVERQQVQKIIEAAWDQMNQFSASMETSVDSARIVSAIGVLDTRPVDFIDALTLEIAAPEGITNFITDDSDFAGVADIRVFTANPDVLAAAAAQGCLITRL